MPTLTSEQAKAMQAKRRSHGRQKPRAQILRMQESLLASATDPKVPPNVRAACARSWDVLEERLRILDNKPLPGHLRPELAQLREARRSRTRKALLSISSADLPAQQGS